MIRMVSLFLCLICSYHVAAIHKESILSNSNAPFFIENKGQLLTWDRKPCPEVLYYAFLENLQIFVMKDRIVYQWSKEEEKDTVKKGVEEMSLHPFDARSHKKLSYSTYRMDMILENSNAQVESQASNPKPGMYHYFLGHLPKEGLTNLKGYARLHLKNVYKGIDWHIYFEKTAHGFKLKYDFVVAPHSPYSQIRWHYSHAASHSLMPSGAIEVLTPFGTLIEPAPVVLQEQKILSSKYIYDTATNRYSYAIDSVDTNKEVRIDPEVDWASYYGGTGYDNITGLYMDSSDNMYMLMVTNSIGLSKNGYQNNLAGNRDVLFSKRDKNKALIWASYYGGEEDEWAGSLIKDSKHDFYISGDTKSKTGIGYNGFKDTFSFDPLDIQDDVFLMKFDSNGFRKWSTYYGGKSMEYIVDIQLDKYDNVYMFGSTFSMEGIATPGTHKPTTPFLSRIDAFLVKFSSSGNRIWGTYFGGQETEHADNIYIDTLDRIHLFGITGSSSGIALNGALNSYNGTGSLITYYAQFNLNGAQLVGSYINTNTGYLGMGKVLLKDNQLICTGIARGNVGNSLFPNSSFQNTNLSTSYNAVLCKIGLNGAVLWGFCYGGTDYESFSNFYIDSSQYIVGGISRSLNLESRLKFLNTKKGNYDAIIACIDTSGNLKWSWYFGDTGIEGGVSYIHKGIIYLYSSTSSTKGISKNGFQNTYGGGTSDGYIAKICDKSSRDTFIRSICRGDSLFFQGKYYDTTGRFEAIYTNRYGCDSVLELFLTVYDTFRNISPIILCKGDSINYNGLYYKKSGIYSFSYKSSKGCDSIEILDIQVFDTLRYIEPKPIFICMGDSFMGHKDTGVYTKNYKSILGCDSIYQFRLSYYPTSHTSERKTICNGYSYKGYNVSGVYFDKHKNKFNCDSIDTLYLTVLPAIPVTLKKDSFCYNDSFKVRNFYVKNTGIYYDTLVSIKGCDSILKYDLKAIPLNPLLNLNDTSICNNRDTIVVNISDKFKNIKWSTNDTTPSIKVYEEGIYSVYVVGNNLCAGSDSFTLKFFDIPNIKIVLPDEIEKNSEVEVKLNLPIDKVNVNGFFWSYPNYISCINCVNPYIKAIDSNWLKLAYTTKEGCKEEDSILIYPIVFSDASGMPNAFSPNNDFKNDLFGPNGRDIKDFDLKIFNRWGEKVFDNNHSKIMWDGMYKESPAPIGSYTYFCTVYLKNKRTIYYKGSFVLMR
jgi:gliding motility-associated-like protein